MSVASIPSNLALSSSIQAFTSPSLQNPPIRGSEATGQATAPAPSADALLKALSEVQKAIEPVAQDLLFSIDKETGRTIVKVVDSATDKVIRQIPSEEILAIAKALDNFQGLLLKQQA